MKQPTTSVEEIPVDKQLAQAREDISTLVQAIQLMMLHGSKPIPRFYGIEDRLTNVYARNRPS
jgi:hypothetical protein